MEFVASETATKLRISPPRIFLIVLVDPWNLDPLDPVCGSPAPKAIMFCSGEYKVPASEITRVLIVSPSGTNTIAQAILETAVPAICAASKSHLNPVIVHGNVVVLRVVLACVPTRPVFEMITTSLSIGLETLAIICPCAPLCLFDITVRVSCCVGGPIRASTFSVYIG